MKDVFNILDGKSNLSEKNREEIVKAVGSGLSVEEIREIYKEAFRLSSKDLKNYQLIFPLSLTMIAPRRDESLSLEERRKEVEEKYKFLAS